MKLIVTAMLGIFLFIASAGVSWMYIFPPAPEADVEEVADASDQKDAFPPAVEESQKQDAMPVAMRPDVPITVEAVVELAQSVMEQKKEVTEAQQQLKRDEKRVQLLFEDLRREREELQAFAKQIDQKISEAKEAVELLKLEKRSVTDQTEALNTIERRTGTIEEATDQDLVRRVKTVKGWFRNLEPEQAAKYLKEFAQQGDIEFVAKLLDSLEDRQIAKVLASFDDAPLVAKIVDTFTKKDTGATLRR